MSTTNYDIRSMDIRGVLIQVAGAQLLLPNAATVEVLSYAEPAKLQAAPDWLHGQIQWRGWTVPLVSFAHLIGTQSEGAATGSKVLILKALGGDARLPYFAIMAQGFPRLVTVSRDALMVVSDHEETLPEGVRVRALFNDEQVLVPDLDAIERLIADVLRPAAA